MRRLISSVSVLPCSGVRCVQMALSILAIGAGMLTLSEDAVCCLL